MVKNLGSWPPSGKAAGLRVLLARPDWTLALLDAFEKGQAQAADLTLDQKQALAAHPDKQIAERSKKLLALGGGLPDADRQKVLEELLPLVKKTGEATAGKVVFTKHCAPATATAAWAARSAPI